MDQTDCTTIIADKELPELFACDLNGVAKYSHLHDEREGKKACFQFLDAIQGESNSRYPCSMKAESFI